MKSRTFTHPHRALAMAIALLLFVAGVTSPPANVPAAEAPISEPATRFRLADFERAGVTLATAGPGVVDFAIDLPGEVRPNADRTAHLGPRFAGTVREVYAGIGDRVRANAVLAAIESDTLARYDLRAPFDGIIVDKHVAPGEVVDRDTTMFILADLSTVWIGISVYQDDLPKVRPGQSVQIAAGAPIPDAETTIDYVSPIVDQATRTATARAVLANPGGFWRPGLFVTATISEPKNAAVAIHRSALQREDGRDIVFVVAGDSLEPRRVTLGQVGRTTAEVLAGLAPGERYASTQSFLVKAELEKGEAGEAEER